MSSGGSCAGAGKSSATGAEAEGNDAIYSSLPHNAGRPPLLTGLGLGFESPLFEMSGVTAADAVDVGRRCLESLDHSLSLDRSDEDSDSDSDSALQAGHPLSSLSSRALFLFLLSADQRSSSIKARWHDVQCIKNWITGQRCVNAIINPPTSYYARPWAMGMGVLGYGALIPSNPLILQGRLSCIHPPPHLLNSFVYSCLDPFPYPAP